MLRIESSASFDCFLNDFIRQSMSNAYRIGTEIPDFRDVMVGAARPLSCSALMKDTQKFNVIVVGLSDLT